MKQYGSVEFVMHSQPHDAWPRTEWPTNLKPDAQHEYFHAGQVAEVRRSLGLKPVFM